MGAAMLAGLSTGVYSDANEAATLFVRRTDRFEPDSAHVRQYAERYELYRTMYAGRAERLRTLSQLSGY
jgi:sugar (pentulose or hexulose) kinase